MDQLDIEITKLYLSSRDLSDKTPEQIKELFFEILHKVESHNVERW